MNPYRIIDVDRVLISGATEPVSLTEAKKWLKVTFTDDDTVIADLITSSIQSVEEFCTLSLMKYDVTLIVDLAAANNRSCIEFELPYQPAFLAVDASEIIVSLNQNGGTTNNFEAVTEGTDYYFDGIKFYKFKTAVPGRYKFEYPTGYANVPIALKQSILIDVADKYENRGDSQYKNITILCEESKRKAQPFKRFAWQ